jgi:DNA-binding LacI/PurR family transcriptional regulator
MSARRSGRPANFHATLALLTHYPPSRAVYFHAEFGQLLQSIKARAHAQGYRTEEFNGHDPALTSNRLSEILQHRGIHGVVVTPLHSITEQVELDWSKFSTVAIGYSLTDVPVSRVSHNHFTGLALAARRSRASGYGRLGLVLPRRVHEKVEKRWLAAFLLDQSEHAGRDPVPALLTGDSDEGNFRAWFRAHRPDALLCLNLPLVQGWLASLGCDARKIALVGLDRRPRDRGIAGIDQDYAHIGAVAADTVIGLLRRNEHGLPAKPVNLLLDGTWVDGRSLPLRKAAPSLR